LLDDLDDFAMASTTAMTSMIFPRAAREGSLPFARVPRMERHAGGRYGGGGRRGSSRGRGSGGGGSGDGGTGPPPGLAGLPWARAAALGPFILADGSAAAEQATMVRVGWDARALYVRFDCADRDAWGTWRQRNDPIYLEEAVEVFLAPLAPLAPTPAGEAAPLRYWELEVSPLGVLFAARVDHPTGRRADLVADTSWECRGLEWQARPTGASQDWWAALAIPWLALDLHGQRPGGRPPAGPPPRRWRANFYRIERPRGGKPEFSCWSPTFTEPPDFHRPDRFGVLELA
jgi:hypothetical protein